MNNEKRLKPKKFEDYSKRYICPTKLFWIRHPIRLIKNLRNARKRFRERGTYGYSYHDLYDMSLFLCKILPEMLNGLATYGYSYPAGTTYEEWHQKLRDAANKMADVGNYLNEDIYMPIAKEGSIDAFENVKKTKDEALDFIKENFFDLWD